MKSRINSFLYRIQNKRDKTESGSCAKNSGFKLITCTIIFILFSISLYAQNPVKTTISGTVIGEEF